MKRKREFLILTLLAAACFYIIQGGGETYAASSYEVTVGDYTWHQAFSACVSRGGHLVTIDSRDEFNTVVGMLENEPYWRGKVFFVGARREPGSRNFYWVDSKDQFYGAPLDDSSNWAFSAWGPGEPSYTSDGIDETVAAIYKYQGNWILNDVPVDMLSAAPDYKGIIGYICEYEDNAEASSYEQQTVSGSNGNASGSYTVRGLNGTANNVHIPREFYFSSGAGAWGTSLYMNEDWSFTGDFHDSNMGETGPGYPGGTCYISNFSGTFSTPEMVTDTCARLELRSLSFTPSEDEKYIVNDILYIGATPYGVYGGEEFYLYFPGQPYALIPEDCRIWMTMFLENKKPDVIPDGMYVLYNISEGDAFVARD